MPKSKYTTPHNASPSGRNQRALALSPMIPLANLETPRQYPYGRPILLSGFACRERRATPVPLTPCRSARLNMVTTTSSFVSLTAATFLWASAAWAASSGPQVVELSAGESAKVQLATGKGKMLKLVSVRESTEPYFESAEGKITSAVVRAELLIDVDGVKGLVVGGPFRMPVRCEWHWLSSSVAPVTGAAAFRQTVFRRRFGSRWPTPLNLG